MCDGYASGLDVKKSKDNFTAPDQSRELLVQRQRGSLSRRAPNPLPDKAPRTLARLAEKSPGRSSLLSKCLPTSRPGAKALGAGKRRSWKPPWLGRETRGTVRRLPPALLGVLLSPDLHPPGRRVPASHAGEFASARAVHPRPKLLCHAMPRLRRNYGQFCKLRTLHPGGNAG
jgi:hypothetical protein